jgi:glycine betaine/proline transport system permease protein
VVPGVVATTIFAIAPGVRLTELGIRQVDREMVEAAHAFGARPSQVLRDVQLPMALPSIMAGVNQMIMLSLSMVVVAGLTGAAGLGAVVVRAVTQLDVASGFEGGLAVVLLAVYLDRCTGGLAERSRRSPLRRRAASGAATPVPSDAPAPVLPAVEPVVATSSPER